MMYACKMNIDHNPQKVRYQREVELPDRLLTLEDISKHLEEGEKFELFKREECAFRTPVNCLIIYGYRLETDEEVKSRIDKAKKYNENYEKFHAKYKSRKK